MKYEESKRTGYQEREDEDFAQNVHIRQEDRGVFMYAVFDGKDQVSPELGPLNENEIIWFAKGYSKSKKRHQ